MTKNKEIEYGEKPLVSNIWNDCPLCGKELYYIAEILVCRTFEKEHYRISFNIDYQILFEAFDLENYVIIYRDSEFYKQIHDSETTISIVFKNKILYESDKILTIDQIKKLIPLL